MISRDVSLYFHIPFCSKKCPYCHFFVLPDEKRSKLLLLESLLQEWKLRLPQLQGKRVVSIYFGGGTPTKLPPSAYLELLNAIRSCVSIAADCEITLEANPEDVRFELMQQFHEIGINRVSLGVQSLNDNDLYLLERTHSSNRAYQAIEEINQAGISNLSIDLMFELPRQTLKSWEQNLKKLARLPITHLSLYNLTFEPQTVFFKRRQQLLPQLPPPEERLKMLQMAIDELESIGLKRYEISAFARPGRESRHNTGYWTGRPFLGFGPSAFSYWEGKRFSNVAHFNKYLNIVNQGNLPVDFEEQLPFPQNLQELLAVQLRLMTGVDLGLFEERYGRLPAFLETHLSRLIDNGWLSREGCHIKLTENGQLFYDSVAVELI